MRRVYVLGAGATRALNSGAPLMGQLLEQALEFSLDPREGTIAAPSARAVKDFLVDVYNMSDHIIPPFEDVLSLVDHCIEGNTPLSHKYSVDQLRQLRKKLIYIMGQVLEVKLLQYTNGSLVRAFLNSLSQQDSIISMNYDLIIENGVLNRGGVVDYHIPTQGNQRLFTDNGAAKTSIYKLHGSLNWLYCPVCQVLLSSNWRKQALEALVHDVNCNKCGTQLEPILITPSFLKNYNNSFIAEIWRKAQKQLQQADEIFFVGYSMPDADIGLRMYFTRAVYANKLIHQGKRCRIHVIDKSPSDRSDVRTRYERIFGEVEYYKDGFDGYIESPLGAGMREISFRGKRITQQAILNALEAFASLYPNTNDFEGWLDNDAYHYAIDYKGKLYPPKHILSETTGISTTEFSGGEETNRVFRELGFSIVSK